MMDQLLLFEWMHYRLAEQWGCWLWCCSREFKCFSGVLVPCVQISGSAPKRNEIISADCASISFAQVFFAVPVPGCLFKIGLDSAGSKLFQVFD